MLQQLGIRVSLEEHRKYITVKGFQNSAVMKHRELRNHNKYEGIWGIWKAVIVPGLIYRNAVLCMASRVRDGLEMKQ